MATPIQCPLGHVLSVDADQAGRQVICPECLNAVLVPAALVAPPPDVGLEDPADLGLLPELESDPPPTEEDLLAGDLPPAAAAAPTAPALDWYQKDNAPRGRTRRARSNSVPVSLVAVVMALVGLASLSGSLYWFLSSPPRPDDSQPPNLESAAATIHESSDTGTQTPDGAAPTPLVLVREELAKRLPIPGKDYQPRVMPSKPRAQLPLDWKSLQDVYEIPFTFKVKRFELSPDGRHIAAFGLHYMGIAECDPPRLVLEANLPVLPAQARLVPPYLVLLQPPLVSQGQVDVFQCFDFTPLHRFEFSGSVQRIVYEHPFMLCGQRSRIVPLDTRQLLVPPLVADVAWPSDGWFGVRRLPEAWQVGVAVLDGDMQRLRYFRQAPCTQHRLDGGDSRQERFPFIDGPTLSDPPTDLLADGTRLRLETQAREGIMSVDLLYPGRAGPVRTVLAEVPRPLPCELKVAGHYYVVQIGDGLIVGDSRRLDTPHQPPLPAESSPRLVAVQVPMEFPNLEDARAVFQVVGGEPQGVRVRGRAGESAFVRARIADDQVEILISSPGYVSQLKRRLNEDLAPIREANPQAPADALVAAFAAGQRRWYSLVAGAEAAQIPIWETFEVTVDTARGPASERFAVLYQIAESQLIEALERP